MDNHQREPAEEISSSNYLVHASIALFMIEILRHEILPRCALAFFKPTCSDVRPWELDYFRSDIRHVKASRSPTSHAVNGIHVFRTLYHNLISETSTSFFCVFLLSAEFRARVVIKSTSYAPYEDDFIWCEDLTKIHQLVTEKIVAFSDKCNFYFIFLH